MGLMTRWPARVGVIFATVKTAVGAYVRAAAAVVVYPSSTRSGLHHVRLVETSFRSKAQQVREFHFQHLSRLFKRQLTQVYSIKCI